MRKSILLLSSAAALLCLALPAIGQTAYPDKPVKIINPFPGGATETYARLIAKRLQEAWGQPVVVEGKPGAGGTIGVAAAAKAPADGYTLLVTSASTQVVQPVVRKNMPYDAEKDLIPIVSTGPVPTLVVVHPSLPVHTLQELIDYARANPGAVTYGSSGLGTALHLAGEVFSAETGVKLLHVPYKSAAQSITDLLGGQVKLMFDTPPNTGPYIRSGKLRGLAIMGPQRVDVLPDLKSTAELGMPKMRFTNWLGLYAPAGTPQAVVDRITSILRPNMLDTEMKNFYDIAGMPHTILFGADFAKASREQRQELAGVVKKAGIELID